MHQSKGVLPYQELITWARDGGIKPFDPALPEKSYSETGRYMGQRGPTQAKVKTNEAGQ